MTKKVRPTPPTKEVKQKQDKDYSEGDFQKALGKATRRLGRPSEPDPKSPKR